MEGALNEKKVSDLVDMQRPFPGLSSYEEKNKSQFGGRNAEIKELINLVENNPLTVVFGKSGIGKTSLIKAGLMPELQKNFYFPVYLRIDYSAIKTPLTRLRELIYDKLKVFDKSISELGSHTLWEYFHDMKLLDGLITPVLILDQFEEIFTLGKDNSELHALITELSDLAENRVPLIVQKEYQTRSEMISSHYGEQPYRVIICLREDYLAQLESLKADLPSIKNSRFRVMQMTVEQAMDAVTKPAKGLVEKDVAEEIIKKLPGISDHDFDASAIGQDNVNQFVVEPFLLSLICYQINEKRIEKGWDKINLELVSQFNVDDVINSFYNNAMKGFSENLQQGIEDTLLTETGFRKLESVEELGSKYDIANNDIQLLIDKRIIRKELRDGIEYVELIHDVLVPVIKQKRDKRVTELREKEKTDAIKRAIELDRVKRKRIVRNILLIMISILIAFGIIYYKDAIDAKKFENLSLAQKLIITSKGASFANTQTAAIMSRTAYMINKKYEVGNQGIFYNSMYERLYDLDPRSYLFQFTKAIAIKSIAAAGKDLFYIGCEDGRVLQKDCYSMSNDPQEFLDLNSKVTSIAISPDKRYIAVAGIFNDVLICDLKNTEQRSFILNTGDSVGNGKSVCFTDDGKLILRLDASIMGWEINGWKPAPWSKRIEVTYEKAQTVKGDDPILWDRNYLAYKFRNSFNCIAVFKDRIALGLDSCLVLIAKDSLTKIKSEDIGITTSVAFDPSGKYLFIGDVLGRVCRMSLSNYSTQCNLYQSGRIKDIACSSDGNYVASTSWDGGIGIWDAKKDWSTLAPLLISPPYVNSRLNFVSFSEDNKNIFVITSDGNIWKLPVNIQTLSDLICQNVTKVDTTVWKQYSGGEDISILSRYKCK